MKLENLKPAKGSTHNSKRVGRGQGSGKGGTATRGTKGAQARAGYEHKIGYEGGQMPIQRRLPKFGFKNPTRVDGYTKGGQLVKVLGNGDITAALEVTAHAFSKSAIAKIEAAGGKTTVIE